MKVQEVMERTGAKETGRAIAYIKDALDVCYFFMQNQHDSGIYNLGTGKARTFLDLAENTFRAMGLVPNIEFIDTPEDIRDKYQYFTEAEMGKLQAIGYDEPFTSLETGIANYANGYLKENKYY